MARAVRGGSASGYLPIPFDVSTQTWAAQVIADGGTVSIAREIVVDELIVGLKADGIWNKLDRLWLFAAENEPSALTDLVAAWHALNEGPLTFTVDSGFVGDGANVISSNAFLTAASRFSQNSAFHCGLAVGTGQQNRGIDADLSPSPNVLYGRWTDDVTYWRVNQSVDDDSGVATNDGSGLWLASRLNPPGTVSLLYRNGVLFDTGVTASTAVLAGSTLLHVLSSGRTQAMAAYGGGLTAAEVLAFHNRLATYFGDIYSQNWADAVVVNGGTVSGGRQSLVDWLITGLAQDGIWFKLDRLWLFAAENTASALTDLIINDLATPVSSPAFTANDGYAGNGTSAYIDTNYNPTADGISYNLNAACAFAWKLETGTDTGAIIGSLSALSVSPSPCIYPAYTDNNAYYIINMNNSFKSVASTDGQGLWVLVRSAQTLATLYRNGVSFDTDSRSSTGLPTENLLVLREVAEYSSKTCSCAGYGGALTSTEVTALYNRISTYMAVVQWAKTVVTNGGSVSAARQGLINDLIYGLKSDGVWSKLDRLWLFAAEDQESALTDLVGLSLAAAINSPTFTVDLGYSNTISPATDQLTTNFDPSLTWPNYSQNSASWGFWSNDSAQRGDAAVGGMGIAGVGNLLYPRWTDDNYYVTINSDGAASDAGASTDGSGFWAASRTNSTTVPFYRNGVNLTTFTRNSSVPEASNTTLLGNTAAFSWGGQCCGFHLGGSLTGTEQLALYNRLRTYMTAVGVP